MKSRENIKWIYEKARRDKTFMEHPDMIPQMGKIYGIMHDVMKIEDQAHWKRTEKVYEETEAKVVEIYMKFKQRIEE